MLPGKKYTPDDLLFIARQRFWLVLVPFAVVAAVTAVLARGLPDLYEARAVIAVVAQQVPEQYIKSTVTTKMADRLPAIAQRILSRAKLEGLIDEQNLYTAERKTSLMEDIVERMKEDITIQPLKADAFTVGYRSSNPEAALKVTERLATYFKDENVNDRTATAESTSQFLEAQVTTAREKLIEQETKLKNYREQYKGQLPTQLSSNMSSQQNKWQNIQNRVEAINRDKDKRSALEQQLADLTGDTPDSTGTGAPVAVPEPDPSGAIAVQGSTAQQLASYRSLLASLQQRGFTAQHPDVVKTQRLIAALTAKADAEALQAPVSAGAAGAGAPKASLAEQQRKSRIASIRIEMDQLDKSIAAKEAEKKQLTAEAADLQARIDALPARESDLTNLMRDYTTLQEMYTGLLAKREQSNISAQLETQEIGQSFRVIDSPRMPERPVSPNRRLINVVGMAAGLAIGLLLVGLVEYRDSSFKTDDEITRLLSLPVLAVVPIMQSDEERKRVTRRSRIVGVGLGSTVMGCFAILIYTFVR